MRKLSVLILMIFVLFGLTCCDGSTDEELFNRNVTITFNTNGGSEVESQTIKRGTCATEPNEPTFGNNSFTGWFNNGKEFDFESPISKNIILDAHWDGLVESNSAKKDQTNFSNDQQYEIALSPASSESKTIIDIPANAITGNGSQSSEMIITSYTIEIAPTSFEIIEEQESVNNLAVAGIDCILEVNGVPVSDFNGNVIVTTYIVKGLSSVQVVYKGDENKTQPVVNDDNTNIADIFGDDTAMGESLGYSKESGKLRFSTTHFSEFYVATNAEVYIIEDNAAMTLGEFRDSVNDTTSPKTYSGKTVQLLKDITMSEQQPWTPIAWICHHDSGTTTMFSGTFDGNNHTIFNMTSTGYEYPSGNDTGCYGFIGDATGATIKNLTFDNATINLPDACLVGFVVGEVSGGKFTAKNITIKSNCSLIAGDNVGGVVGSLWGDETSDAIFEDITSEATVTGPTAAYVGMLTGSIKGYKNLLVKNCTNKADLGISSTPSNVTYGMVGGMIGYIQRITTKTTFDTCCNSGNLVGYNDVGGMVGNFMGSNQQNIMGEIEFTNCSNSGTITVLSGGNVGGTGGMVGYSGDNSGMTFNSCSNTGNIGSNTSKCSGGLFAHLQTSFTASNCSISGIITCGNTNVYALGYLLNTKTASYSDITNNTSLTLCNVSPSQT